MKTKMAIFLSILFFMQGYGCVAGRSVRAAEEMEEDPGEDLEIIKNLDFLDHLDLFKEDLAFLADYEDIDQPELIGEGDE